MAINTKVSKKRARKYVAKKKRFPRFPRQVYVRKDGDSDSTWLTAYDNVNDLDDGDEIGVYELMSVVTAKVTKTLE